jgi:hypothetical protein
MRGAGIATETLSQDPGPRRRASGEFRQDSVVMAETHVSLAGGGVVETLLFQNFRPGLDVKMFRQHCMADLV